MGFVQGAVNSSATSRVAVAFPAGNTSGNTLIVFAQVAEPFGGLTGMTISDTQGNTWTALSNPPTELNNILPGVWICTNCKAGANTVTVTYGYGSQNIAAGILEYSLLGALDVHAVSEATSIARTTTSVTTTYAGDILVGLSMNEGPTSAIPTNSSGWTSELTGSAFPSTAGAMAFGVFDITAGAAGAYSCTGGPVSSVSYQYLYVLAFRPNAPPTSQTITFPTIPNHAPTDAPFTLAATASSGLTVSYAVISGPATVSGNTVTLTGGLGTVTIQATQAGNSTYAAATPVNQSFTVALDNQTITFGAIPNHVANDPPFTLSPTASSGLPVSLAVISGPATIAGHVVTLTGSPGIVTIQATQPGNATYAAATPVSQSFAVTAAQRGDIAFDQIRASDRTGNGPQLLTYTVPAPPTATSAGTPGQVAFDAAGNWYWCYAVNSWARIGPAGYGSAASSPPSW